MLEDIKKDTRIRMRKSLDALHNELKKIRTGRAHPSLLEHVQVDYYGSMVPVSQAANVKVEDARTLAVTPFDKSKARCPTYGNCVRCWAAGPMGQLCQRCYHVRAEYKQVFLDGKKEGGKILALDAVSLAQCFDLPKVPALANRKFGFMGLPSFDVSLEDLQKMAVHKKVMETEADCKKYIKEVYTCVEPVDEGLNPDGTPKDGKEVKKRKTA